MFWTLRKKIMWRTWAFKICSVREGMWKSWSKVQQLIRKTFTKWGRWAPRSFLYSDQCTRVNFYQESYSAEDTWYIYIWHLFRFWHILSSYYNTLYILLFSAGTSYGIHIFMYAVKCILTCVRYLIYISIPCISLLSYSSYLSTLCSNIKVFTCHNI